MLSPQSDSPRLHGLAEADAVAGLKPAADPQTRLARKAASARLARARHKSQVSALEDNVSFLRQRVADMEAQQLAEKQAWSQQLRTDLQDALTPAQWQVLSGWLEAAKPPPPPNMLEAEQNSMADATLLFRLSNHASPRLGPSEPPRYANAPPLGAALRAQLHASAARGRRQETTAQLRGAGSLAGLSPGGTPLINTTPAFSHGLPPSSILHAPLANAEHYAPPMSSQTGALQVRVGACTKGQETSPTTVMATQRDNADLAEAEIACALGIVGLGTPKTGPQALAQAPPIPLLELDAK